LLFAVLCCIYELFFRRYRWTAIWCLVLAAVVPLVFGNLLFKERIYVAFTDLLPISWKITLYENRQRMIELIYILYLLLPVITIVAGIRRIFTGRANAAATSWYNTSHRFIWGIESLALLFIAATIALSSHSKKTKALFAVDYYSCHKKWPEVLAAAQNYSYNDFRQKSDSFVTHAVNLALYNTGRLGYDMLSYPQYYPALFLTIQRITSETLCWKIADTQIGLGLLNIAENSMAEAFQLRAHPLTLKRLALINMVKANYGAAQVYLRALNKTFFYNKWAKKYIKLLEADPKLLAGEEEIRKLRSIMLKEEFTYLDIEYDKLLLKLLEENKQNQMAFEYMMALFMLTKQLDKFVENLGRLKDFSYAELPRHYEQAILVYKTITGKPVNLHGFQISPESIWQAQSFIREYKYLKEKTDEQMVYNRLAENYGDNYFFYYTYGHSRIKK